MRFLHLISRLNLIKPKRLTAIILLTASAMAFTATAYATTQVDKDNQSVTVSRESDSTEQQIEDTKAQILALSSNIEELSAEKEEYLEAMSQRITYFYENESSNSVLETILGADSFADMLSAVEREKELYDYDAEQMKEYAALIEEMQGQQDELNTQLESLYAEMEEESSEETGLNLVEEASQYMGVKYVWGGTTPSGFDCSGFIIYCVNNCGNGWSMPRLNAEGIRKTYCTAISEDELQPGDLIFFQGTYSTSGASHIAIYIGEGMMIHASGKGVSITNMKESYWVKHFMQYGRLNF